MRLAQLDTVRTIAIALVICEHYGGPLVRNNFPIGPGSLGVSLFFCLSGFLITSILLAEFRSGAPRSTVWFNFYVRRFLRLVPAFWAWIAILTVLKIEPIASSWAWHASYLTNVWIAMGHPMNDFWSLAVEEQFYIFWPFVIAFTPRKYLLWVVAATTVYFSVIFKGWAQYNGIDPNTIQPLLMTNLTELGVGSLLGVVSFQKGKAFDFAWYTPKVELVSAIAGAIGLTAAVVAWYTWGKGGSYRYYLNDFLCTLPFIWLIMKASTGFTGFAGKVFDSSALQYVGRISYGLYLTHNFVPDIIEQYFPPMPRLLFGLSSITASFAISALSWHYFERPILGLKDRFKRYGEAAPNGRRVNAPAE